LIDIPPYSTILSGWWFGSFYFFHYMGMSSSQLTFTSSFFPRGQPPAPNDSGSSKGDRGALRRSPPRRPGRPQCPEARDQGNRTQAVQEMGISVRKNGGLIISKWGKNGGLIISKWGFSWKNGTHLQ
jgi:hypothetical protein